MTSLRRFAAPLAVLLLVVSALADDPKPDADGFVPLFNGKDLTGWHNVNCAPGTFFVKDGEIITTGKPTGFMSTLRQYENFIAEFEWMHVNKTEVGNSGFFVWGDPLPAVGSPYTRGIEVQVLVNLTYTDKKTGAVTASSHGDLFSIWGATCKPDRPHPQGWSRCIPSENRAKGGGEWNHYKVVANDGVIKLHVNGKEVSGVSECKPRKGYLALESEGAECHFRNLKIKELPSTNPKPEEIAGEQRGFKQLFIGDLTGWHALDDGTKNWHPKDWVLHYDGKAGRPAKMLWSDKEYGDAEFIADFKFPAKKDGKPEPCEFLLRGNKQESLMFLIHADGLCSLNSNVEGRHAGFPGNFAGLKTGAWNRLHVVIKGRSVTIDINGKPVLEKSIDVPAKGSFVLNPDGEMDFANLFVLETK